MNDEYRTMYARHRRAAVALMCDVYPAPTLAVEHLRASTALAAGLLPEVAQLPLSLAVVQLLHRMQEFNARHRPEDLLRISFNGQVDEHEAGEMAEIQNELQGVVQAALQLKYAQGAGAPYDR